MSNYLHSEETTDPYKTLSDFFDFATVQEARDCLGGWLLASFKAHDGEELNYLHLYQQLEKLVEASWLLHQSKGRG